MKLILSGTHAKLVELLAHEAVGAAILVMGAVGFVGILRTFF